MEAKMHYIANQMLITFLGRPALYSYSNDWGDCFDVVSMQIKSLFVCL